MAWVYLFLAGVFEVIWAYAMKQSVGFTRLIPTLITFGNMVISFALLSLAMRSLPLGTAYAIWTGIGAVGTFFVGITVMNEPVNLMRVVAVLFLVTGLVLLKLSTDT